MENQTDTYLTFDRYEFVQSVPLVAIPCLFVLGIATFVGVFGNGLILVAVMKIKELDTVESIFIKNLAISDMYVLLIANPVSMIGIATFVGVFGNGLILIAVMRIKELDTVQSIFMTNLAISDMFVPLIANPLSIIAKLEGEVFFEGIPHFCRTVGCLCTVSCIVSLGTIACMSFNRCIHICLNHYYHRIFTRKSCIIMCVTLYAVGSFLVLLNAIGIGDHEFDRKSLQCIWDRMASYPYTVVFSVALVWIPIVIVGISYGTIFITVYKSQRRIHNRHSLEASNGVNKGKFQRSIHLAKTLFIIYAVFSICWIPYALLIVIDTDDSFSYVVHLYVTMWAHLHPSVNWLVYYLTNNKFTEAFQEILGIQRCFISCRQRHHSPDRNMVIEINETEM